MRVNGKKVGDKPDPGPAFGLSSGLANLKVTVFVGIRAQQKEKTRRTLIEAAFSQLCANRSFSNLSLRAKEWNGDLVFLHDASADASSDGARPLDAPARPAGTGQIVLIAQAC